MNESLPRNNTSGSFLKKRARKFWIVIRARPGSLVWRERKSVVGQPVVERNMQQHTDIQNTTFRNKNTLEVWRQPNRTRGRPRNKWTETALQEMWTDIKKQKTEHRTTIFDLGNNQIVSEIKEYAKQLTGN